MARIHIESEHDSPLYHQVVKPSKTLNRAPTQRTNPELEPSLPERDSKLSESGTKRDETEKAKSKSKQRPLKRVENNSVLLQPLKVFSDVSKKDTKQKCIEAQSIHQLDFRSCKKRGENTELPLKQVPCEGSERDSLDDIKFWPKTKSIRAPSETYPPPATPRAARQKGRLFKVPPPLTGSLQLFEPSKLNHTSASPRPTSSSDNDRTALLTYEPPKRLSPHKKTIPPLRPSTPPPSPSKFKLSSPSKGAPIRIPTPPLQQNLDEFWSQEVINQWNDQYSPRKEVISPRKKRFATPPAESGSDDDCPSPSTSPRKAQSPAKRSKEVTKAKKAFEASKQQFAEDFLHELDTKITNGQIGELAASGGGVRIIWSKKLNSTAGRANWRRETTKTKLPDGNVERTFRHFANIELAEKVIDDEERLINVLAHEFCHLANFMVGGVKDNPHGKEFKIWARKCSTTFAHRGVQVTTKHSYTIDYKYIWECVSCGYEFKRHSKSIDPTRHTCGSCKSKLVQTKPAVRNASEYQLFVKEHFQRVKRENSGATHGTVMEILGRQYREQKDRSKCVEIAVAETAAVDDLVKVLDVITLDD